MKKKIVCLLLCFVLLATAVPAVGIAAGAANLVTVDYKDETGADVTIQSKEKDPDSLTHVGTMNTAVKWSTAANQAIHFASDVTFAKGVVVDGTDANLYLPKGVTVTVKNGIYVPATASLRIFGEGTLIVTGDKDGNAGIGGNAANPDSGKVYLYGGYVYANGGLGAAGIGSGYNVDDAVPGTSGDVLVCGSKVVAKAGDCSAGIGGGYQSTCGKVTVKSGTVDAKGADGCCGVGCGDEGTVTGGVFVDTGLSISTKKIIGKYEDFTGNTGSDLSGVLTAKFVKIGKCSISYFDEEGNLIDLSQQTGTLNAAPTSYVMGVGIPSSTFETLIPDVEEGYVFYGWCDENGLKQTEISTETLGNVKLYARIGEEDKTAECISGSAVGGWFKDEANGNKKVLTVAIGGILDLTSVELSDVSEYGIYIYHSGDEQGTGEEAAFSKMDTELLDEGGLNYFYAYVRVEEANRDKTYYGVAYVIVNGEYYFSEIQSASVGANPVEVDPEKGIKGEED